jgi:hypothetical protein
LNSGDAAGQNPKSPRRSRQCATKILEQSEVVLSAINDQKFASTFPSEISGDEYLHKSDIRFFFLPVPVTVISLSKRRFNLS